MNSILDHHMKLNGNNYYPYGKTTDTPTYGGDGVLTAFNGESVSGTAKTGDPTCIGGLINLHPDWNTSVRVRYIPTSIGSETYPIVDPYGWVGVVPIRSTAPAQSRLRTSGSKPAESS
jgi:hypothetical protein